MTTKEATRLVDARCRKGPPVVLVVLDTARLGGIMGILLGWSNQL
jgi:hypothetical protein